jgi:NTP pyrophosphatase (non-canonical NTP hydrolase)
MNDATTTIGQLQQLVRAFNAERDWARYHTPRNCAMALSVEASELLELYLWSADAGPQPPVASRVPQVADEAADVLVTLLNFCDAAGIDLAAATASKLLKSAEKYPVAASRGRLDYSTMVVVTIRAIAEWPASLGWKHVRSNQSSASGPR